MTVTITIEAQGPFSGDQRPVRSGLYMRTAPTTAALTAWSHFNARTKIWSIFRGSQGKAYSSRDLPSAYQRLPWYALPYGLPAGTRLERIEGLVFRVIPPKS